MKHPDQKTNVTTISLNTIVANGLKIEDYILNYTLIENVGVSQGIVGGHSCLVTFMKRNIQCGLALYR